MARDCIFPFRPPRTCGGPALQHPHSEVMKRRPTDSPQVLRAGISLLSRCRMRLPDPSFWRNKRVLVTGHLGFKGGWLCAWLGRMGAEIHGLDKNPDMSVAPAHLPLKASHTADVTDRQAVLAI